KKNLIKTCVTTCLAGYAGLSYGADINSNIDNENIVSGSIYNNTSLSLNKNVNRENLVLTGDSTLYLQGDSQVTNTKINGTSHIQMQQFGYNYTLGKPIIQDTYVNENGSIDMGAGSVSFGQLFIGKSAILDIDNNDMDFTDVSVNKPVPAADVYIENLTLAGTTNIGPSWTGSGEDGDAPLPEKPGPVLVTRIDNLTMRAGSQLTMMPYTSGVQFNRLELKNLSGEGNFYLATSLADGLSDKIYVTEKATGKFGLLVHDSGREIATPQNTQLVYINSGDASFNLLNNGGIVEAGVWKYTLNTKTDNGHTEWFLVGGKQQPKPDEPKPQPKPDEPKPQPKPDEPKPQPKPDEPKSDEPKPQPKPDEPKPQPKPALSNSAQAVMNMATAPQSILNVENSTLRQRIGNLRRNDGSVGVWARYLSNNSHLSDKRYSSFRSNLNGIQIGADHQSVLTDGKILLGAFTSYSKSNIKSENINNGNIRSYSGGVYATWIDNSSFYIDAVLKANHFSNEIQTNMNSGTSARGDYNQNAFVGSTETGYSFEVTDNVTITPYGKIAYSRIGKSDYSLSNGMKTNIHSSDSVQGEIGALLEAELMVFERSVRPYAKAAISREFIKNNEVEINNISLDSNYSGNTGKYGLGLTADVGDKASVYAEIDYQKGNKLETPVNATAGFRVSF
ncbi:TPA: autotransporter outer membrane beta-barrel domain-containing protein, partial [Salmonella enterica]|nr:autotransporter outer membrane beta-barrel domain-containing protein [Salmonella enterica]HDC2349328.1 autotransporter outer membrane beta-barrel domain-containing protein [Salmonella enterica]